MSLPNNWRKLRDDARQILSEVKCRRGNPETDTAIERSPALAKGVLALLAALAEAENLPDPMEGLGEDDVYDDGDEDDE